MKIVLLSVLVVLSSLSVARAYPDGDARNYRNTLFIRAHFEINRCIRNLKADLGVIPSSDAKTALIADFQSLGSYREVRCVSGGDSELDSGSMVCVQSVRWKSPTGATR